MKKARTVFKTMASASAVAVLSLVVCNAEPVSASDRESFGSEHP